MVTIVISITTCILMILSILFFPKIKIGNKKVSSYWIISLLGAILLLLLKKIDINYLFNELTSNNSMNPIKILILFVSMTFLSTYLDEVGLFKYIANLAVKKAGHSQIKLFVYLYIFISILTVFTSNDIIILTFTPFICYFSKNTKINPIPFLVTEFIAANTWSLMFLIGNPTNIYIGSKFNIDFLFYLKNMFFPTLTAGITSFIILFSIFKKQLKKPIESFNLDKVVFDKPLLIIGLFHLCSCTILLILSAYISFEMWLITLFFALSLIICTLIYKLISKKYIFIYNTIRRIPYELIPFVLSMFTIVLCLKQNNITNTISDLINNNYILYIITSFFGANLLNNIPMSVLFSEILTTSTISLKCVFGVILCSNLGAILTPIGALAGIMWMNLLKKYKVNYSFLTFMKYGFVISIPTLILSSLVLFII